MRPALGRRDCWPRSAAEAIEPRTRRPFYTVRCAALLDNTLDFNEFHELSEKTELFISGAVQDPLPPSLLAPRPFPPFHVLHRWIDSLLESFRIF